MLSRGGDHHIVLFLALTFAFPITALSAITSSADICRQAFLTTKLQVSERKVSWKLGHSESIETKSQTQTPLIDPQIELAKLVEEFGPLRGYQKYLMQTQNLLGYSK